MNGFEHRDVRRVRTNRANLCIQSYGVVLGRTGSEVAVDCASRRSEHTSCARIDGSREYLRRRSLGPAKNSSRLEIRRLADNAYLPCSK